MKREIAAWPVTSAEYVRQIGRLRRPAGTSPVHVLSRNEVVFRFFFWERDDTHGTA